MAPATGELAGGGKRPTTGFGSGGDLLAGGDLLTGGDLPAVAGPVIALVIPVLGMATAKGCVGLETGSAGVGLSLAAVLVIAFLIRSFRGRPGFR